MSIDLRPDRAPEGLMHPGLTNEVMADQLLRIARDPELRQSVYERLGDYCHQCRNRLNSLKLSLYLAMRQSCPSRSSQWIEIDRTYQDLERRVDRVQTLCRPMTLSRVTLGLDLLINDRTEAWTRLMSPRSRGLEFVPPAGRAVASFDVERLGQALDALVDWRAMESVGDDSATFRWWVEAGHAHIVWEEFRAGSDRPTTERFQEGSTWTLPLLARVAMAHGGDCQIHLDRGWRCEITWPSQTPAP